MGKSKRKHSSSKSSGGKVNSKVSSQIKFLLKSVAFVFVFFSIFDYAGSLGHYIYTFTKYTFGGFSYFYAIFMLWLLLKKYFPERFSFRWMVFSGTFLLVLAVTGILHSMAGNVNLLALAQKGMGGGMLGYFICSFFSSVFGELLGKLILFVLLLIGLMLILDKALIPFFVSDKGDEDEEETSGENQVKVMGEIKPGPIDRFRGKLGSQNTVKVAEMNKPIAAIRPAPMVPTNWSYPPTTLLEKIDMKPQAGNLQKRIETIEKTLKDFGIDVKMTEVNIGPTVTQFTLKPSEGVKLNQITARQDDLALALSAHSLRVEAPIPGKGLVGVEIPNDKKAIVGIRELLESKTFKASPSKLTIVLGRDAAGVECVADLARMPHLLIAGATGSGKSVCINSVILSLLVNNSPEELRMILVDPKRVELNGYNGLPHLLTPVITESKDTVSALAYCVREMERRYKLFASSGKRNIEQYNQAPDLVEGHLPFIVLVIDELADLMMVAAREVEGSIVRLAQMARAVGIHLVIATQRPSVDVITGLIKANIPTRIAFAVASQIDSRTIIDMAGAEKLLGYGDMLYVSTEIGKPKRIQGVFVPEKDINAVVAHIKMQEEGDRYDPAVLESHVVSRLGSSRENGEIDDELFQEAFEVIKQAGKASTTLLQTRLSVGYARAARLIQSMEDQGLIGPAKGSKPREVYGTMSNHDSDIADYPDSE